MTTKYYDAIQAIGSASYLEESKEPIQKAEESINDFVNDIINDGVIHNWAFELDAPDGRTWITKSDGTRLFFTSRIKALIEIATWLRELE